MDGSDHNPWTVSIGWAAATVVLIVVTLTLDPLWSYYSSFVAGLMTAFSVFKAARSQWEERRLDLEDEVLLLEVRHAKTEEWNESAAADPKRKQPRPGGDAAENS